MDKSSSSRWKSNSGGGGGGGDIIFDKILFEGFEKCLRIPRSIFIENLPEESSQLASLKGPSGNCWHVKLDVTPHGLYLQDGWATFSIDHSLHKYDYLLFKYEGNMQFSVKIFDKFACKREDAFNVKPSQDWILKGRQNTSKPLTGLVTEKLGTTNLSHLPHPRHVEKPQTPYAFEAKSPHRCDQLNLPRGELPSSSKLHRQMITSEIYVKEKSYTFTSYFPHFVTDMKASCVVRPFNMTIPAEFGRLHLPSTSMMLELRNGKGKRWKVYCSISDRYRLSGGFRSFACDNQLKRGDVCVFELVDKLALNVNIYRC